MTEYCWKVGKAEKDRKGVEQLQKGRRAEKQEEEKNDLGVKLVFGVQIITILAKAIIYQTLTSVPGKQPFIPQSLYLGGRGSLYFYSYFLFSSPFLLFLFISLKI